MRPPLGPQLVLFMIKRSHACVIQFAIVIMVGLGLFGSALAQSAQENICEKSTIADPDLAIRVCAVVIQSRQGNLIAAFGNRSPTTATEARPLGAANAPITSANSAGSNVEWGVDGVWCPLAHCTQFDTSFQSVTPLLSLSTVQQITDPRVSPIANFSLGCTTGQSIAVCAYDSPSFPAIVAYNYSDGSVSWLNSPNDLPPVKSTRRYVKSPLLVVGTSNGGVPQELVIASNPLQIVAYTSSGELVWKRHTLTLTPLAPNGVGAPVSFSIDNANELVAATNAGWIIKLDPADGSTIDAYQMNTNVFVNNVLYQGTFITTNSSAIYQNLMYLIVQFNPASTPNGAIPVFAFVVRIQLTQPGVSGMETKIKPLTVPLSPSDPTPDRAAIGQGQAEGSPSIMVDAGGNVLAFAEASDDIGGGFLQPAIVAVRDGNGALGIAWRSILQNDRSSGGRAGP